ncbi:hypothetical protein M2138_001319 [Dysgonomonadaceae bacterium PH5-43]|nr:hypothetical protein [Dysgonomonadaceae bacterium PH5-43]
MKIFGNILLILLLCSFSVVAQKNISLSGTLFDKDEKEPLIGVGVGLLNPKDSTVITGATTDQNGVYSIKNLASGNYLLKFSYLGYKTTLQKVTLSNEQPNKNLGTQYLEIDAIRLREAVIVAETPEMIVKNDTIEFNAESFKVTENAVVEDLLKRLPGVEVDKDGKITANGKSIPKILVDGKEFFSDDAQVASKNLPAEMVEKVQVIDRKSETARLTGFDDGEEETIINLTTKPGMKRGTVGNAYAGAGADLANENDFRYRMAGFLNKMQDFDRYTVIVGKNNNNNMGAQDLGAQRSSGMRTRRGSGGITTTTNIMANMNKEFSTALSVNGDVRYTGIDRLSKNKSESATLSETISQLDRSSSLNKYISDAVAANFRLEWKPDTMNTLIFRPNFSFNKDKSYQEESLERSDYDTSDMILTEEENSKVKGDGYNLGANLDYSHKFNSKRGRTFTISLNGSYNDNFSYENTFNQTYRYTIQHDSIQNRRDESDNTSKSFRANLSFVEPIGKNNFLQFFYRISYNDSENVNSTYDLYENLYGHDPLLLISMIETDSIASLVLDQSRSTLRNSTTQRIGLSFKAIREKFNYTIGFNVDPSNSLTETYQPSSSSDPLRYSYYNRLPNMIGDSVISSIKQNVINFSPTVNFNYLFSQRTNLRIDYSGQTNQPSASQLRDYTDTSRPNSWVTGNPNLKPGYRNSLNARFQKYVIDTQLNYNLSLNGGFSINDIVSIQTLRSDGIRETTYDNINGNWNMGFRGGINSPLRNKKFSLGSNVSVNYSDQKSYVSNYVAGNTNTVKNTKGDFSTQISANGSFRSDLFDLGLRANFNYNHITYTVRPENNRDTYNYGLNAYTTWYLPFNITIESDITYTARKGYTEGYDIPETIWNASITKRLFSKGFNSGSIKIDIYDILQDRNSISASYTNNGYRISESNSLPSYFMASVIYKFANFENNSAKRSRGGEEGGPNPESMRRRMEMGGGNRGGGGPPAF